MRLTSRSIFLCLVSWFAASRASADDRELHTGGERTASGRRTPTAAWPVSPYDAPAADGYGHAGQLELGGAISGRLARDVRDASASLSIGRFVAERFALAALTSVAHLDAGAQAATLWSALLEPSYHLALAPRTFGVLGMGAGLAYQHRLGTGFAVAPRVGVRVLVGERVAVTPMLSYAYVTHRARDDDRAALAVAGALRLELGFAALW